MIFCIDIGNSNIKYAIFDGSEVKATFRVTSKRDATSDEYGVIVRDLLREAGIPKKSIKGVIMSSVIPSLNYTMEHMCRDYLGVTPLIVGPGVKTGLNIKTDNPKEVGSDIIVDSVSAIKKLGVGTPIIAIDFGTATTYCALTKEGNYGMISPPMDAQVALNEICKHLLGEDWHVTTPMSTEQVNTNIVYEIERKYKKVIK